jgi:hypothetical protein
VGACLGAVATGSTTLAPFCGSYRINSITVWPAAGGTAGITWYGNGTAEQALSRDDAISEDIPTGITVEPRPLCFRPPAGSFQSMWQSPVVNGTDNLFQYYGTLGSVWDLNVTYTTVAYVQQNSVTVTGPATSGTVYYLALDGASLHNLVPQGLPTIF